MASACALCERDLDTTDEDNVCAPCVLEAKRRKVGMLDDSAEKPRILLTMPHGGKVDFPAAYAFNHASSGKKCTIDLFESGSAGANLNHNICWIEPLNRIIDKPTHIAMLHADMHAEPGWLDILLEEMLSSGADVIAAVVPIKDERGLTSTAIDGPSEKNWPRRLTMTEIFDMPVTFTDPNLVVNTGCWLAKVGPWHSKVWFEGQDGIVCENGRWRAHFNSEDWNWSRMLRAGGAKVFATRAVRIVHERAEWTNQKAWGTWETDWDYQERAKQLAARAVK